MRNVHNLRMTSDVLVTLIKTQTGHNTEYPGYEYCVPVGWILYADRLAGLGSDKLLAW